MLTLIFGIWASEPPPGPGERLKRPGLIGLTYGNIEPSQAANSSNFDPGYLKELRKECAKNSIIGYLNINSLRNKIVDLRQVLYESELDILAVSETKLSDEFPNPQFNTEGYYNPA